MSEERGQAWPVFLLAAIAGYVDAFGYMTLAQVFTAHMSGNAAALGALIARHQWPLVLRHGLAIPAFTAGVATGVYSEQAARRARLRSPVLPALVAEALCILAFLLLDLGPAPAAGSGRYFALLCLLAGSMGLQSAALQRAEGSTIRTTFVTGMLMSMAQECALGLDEAAQGVSGALRRRGVSAVFFGAIFCLFMAGAVCGGLGRVHWKAEALAVPLAALAAAALIEWRRAGRPRRP
ncbi:MAG TPA: YoaK family protein [Opitutaceae bacterium]|jgi:uncharacterized membrane protein YoaK (UPF0700 family)|nr:YoaK family protein [Opitutaceae bacterium]